MALLKYQYLLVYVFSAFLVCSFTLGYTPILISYLFVFFSVFTYFSYSDDKSAAINGEWRISESTLHFLALIGGWPGALLAQERLRHKTQKKAFRRIFWITVFVNSSLIVWLHTPDGQIVLRLGASTMQSFATELFGPGLPSKIVQALTTF